MSSDDDNAFSASRNGAVQKKSGMFQFLVQSIGAPMNFLRVLVSLLLLTALASIGFPKSNQIPQQKSDLRIVNSSKSDKIDRPSVISTTMTCPARRDQIKNYVESFDEYAAPARQRIKSIENYVKTYRTQKFDAWYRTYEQVLDGMRHWKSTRYSPNIQSGETIYESACGIGLNLLMTLEILHDNGIQNITVFGNEYLAESVELGHQVLNLLLPTYQGHKGVLCASDSTNLKYVPANAFDLVFTGYLSELYDPLELNLSETATDRRYQALCRASAENVGADWKIEKLLDIAEERHQAWYGQWVNEMIRIAKPGKVIIIEQQRESSCGSHRPDFRGLSRDWWYRAVDKYQWDVDPSSFDFEDDVLYGRRYHVLMRKNITPNSSKAR